MNTQHFVTLSEKIEQLRNQLTSHPLDSQLILSQSKEIFDEFRKAYNEFKDLLEWAQQEDRGNMGLKSLYHQVAGWNESDLMERLKKIGYKYNQKTEIKDSFNNQGYRILELTRAGRYEDVFYAILRIFVSNRENFPWELSEAFKPIYSLESFKVFIFSFLSGLLGEEVEQKENNNDE
ncbi:MAG: hypothetical protein K6T34_09280 [Thermoflavifilum sp.]|nr:hypothetical protein [Thermoflavifilum sp.]